MSKLLLKSQIQKIIEFKKWTLNPLQNRTIECIVNGAEDVIISAPTASGKTEAALFPTISETFPDVQKQLKILYISPLIALINDQYARLCRLNESDSVKINITKWHSDVSAHKKQMFLREKPYGILIITPESLESFLVNKRALHVFDNIEYYIIDEFHDFLGEIRGDQLKSILKRIDEITLKKPRKILLSATLSGDESCKKWLNTPNVEYIQDQDINQKPLRSVQYFENENVEGYNKKLDKATLKNKSLIFGNSKANLELVCYQFKKYTNNNRTIAIHHGSLDKKLREQVEDRLKEKDDISVFCTNTLELGIDINNIDQVSLLEPPFSVSSFVQRIGRSGRRRGHRINFNLFPTMIPPYITGFPQLRTSLIRSLALIDLREEGWIEPKEFQTYTYSIFVHQMLSIVAQNSPSTTSINELYICLQDFHEKVSRDDYKKILDYLIKNKYCNQKQGEYVDLGLEGIKLTKSYDFYSVFSTKKEWELFDFKTNEHLGVVSREQKLKENDILLFSGNTWEVLEIDKHLDKVKLAIVDNSIDIKPIKLPLFISGGGSIHKEIHKKMLSIYEGNNFYSFLNEEGNKALQDSRKEYKKLLQFNKKFVPMFMGSQVTKLISFILQQENKANHYIRPCYIGLYSNKIDQSDLNNLLRKKYYTRENIKSLIQNLSRELLYMEKYDYLLPDSILQKSYIDHQFSFNDYLEYLETNKEQKHSA